MMRSVAYAAVVLIALSACAPTSQGGDVDWPKVARCAPDANDAVAEVSRILLDGNPGDLEIGDIAVQELEQLAAKYGPTTIACLVDLVASDWLRPGASANPDRAAAAMRGRDFINTVARTRIEREGEPDASLLRRIFWYPRKLLQADGFAPRPLSPSVVGPWHAQLAAARGLRA